MGTHGYSLYAYTVLMCCMVASSSLGLSATQIGAAGAAASVESTLVHTLTPSVLLPSYLPRALHLRQAGTLSKTLLLRMCVCVHARGVRLYMDSFT